MVRVILKGFWIIFKGKQDKIIRGDEFKGFEFFLKIVDEEIGHKVVFKVVSGVVMVLLNGGFFDGFVEDFDLAVGPRMLKFGELMGDAVSDA